MYPTRYDVSTLGATLMICARITELAGPSIVSELPNFRRMFMFGTAASPDLEETGMIAER
jgi:hypothetical protein